MAPNGSNDFHRVSLPLNHYPKFHVLLTSYEIASMESSTLKQLKWEGMIVDEAHRLKAGTRGKLFQALTMPPDQVDNTLHFLI